MNPWNETTIAQLRELWAGGQPAEEIGRIMGGLNKNQILGKVHRLGLKERPHHGGRPCAADLVGDKRDEVIAMLMTGRGACSTAHFCGVKEYAVRKIVEEMARNGTVRAPASTKPIVFPVVEAKMIRSSYQTVFDLIVVERPKPLAVLPAWVSRPIPPAKACCAVEPGERKHQWLTCDAPIYRGSYCEAHAARYFAQPMECAA